jgi:hypothetical protein
VNAEKSSSDFDAPHLHGLKRLALMTRRLGWFSNLGRSLTTNERMDAEAYVAALGFPDVAVATVADWEEAESCVVNPGWNTAWWEAEEQLRAALLADALVQAEEHDLMRALTMVTAAASDTVHAAAEAAAERDGVGDPELIRCAAGAATQAAYQAALVLAAGADDDHAFAAKFRLFAAGRWPLGIVGQTFSIF